VIKTKNPEDYLCDFSRKNHKKSEGIHKRSGSKKCPKSPKFLAD
jgi:hypothetical protein